MTGREMALKLGARFSGEGWVAELARRSGELRDKVEWHLQEEMEPPASIADAARGMMERGEGKSGLPRGDLNADDLPFSGVPQFLGKLHKD